MKTITSIIKIVGKESTHESVDDLVDAVLDKCKEEGITHTTANNEITKTNIRIAVFVVLRNIRNGKGKWKTWSIRQGHNYLRLFDDNNMIYSIKKKNVLEAFDFHDEPKLKVEINPALKGVDAPLYYKTFNTLQQVNEFLTKEPYDYRVFIVVGNTHIELDTLKDIK